MIYLELFFIFNEDIAYICSLCFQCSYLGGLLGFITEMVNDFFTILEVGFKVEVLEEDSVSASIVVVFKEYSLKFPERTSI